MDDSLQSKDPSDFKSIAKESTIKAALSNKFRNYLFLYSAMSMIIIGLAIFYSSRSYLLDEAYKRLDAVNVTVGDQLEEKLEALKGHARVLSANHTVVDAMENFRHQFRLINADTSLLLSDNEFENAVINLKSYYNAHYLAPLNRALNSNHTVEEFFPQDRRTRLLQHLYISGNPNPPGEKHLLDKGLDFSTFSKKHLKFHPFLRHVVENYDLKDLLLVDNENGYIVYSTAKNVDFGTSLISGPYRQTLLANAVKKASETGSRDFVYISDIEFYYPAGAAPVFYVTSPVFNGNRKIGILAFKIAIDEIERIVSVSENESNILGETGENLIIGRDFRVRNTMRRFKEEPEKFKKQLRKLNFNKEVIEKMQSLRTTTLLFQVNTDAALKALQGESGQESMKSEDGNSKVVAYRPVESTGPDWAILTIQNRSEIVKNARGIVFIALGAFFLVLLMIYIAGQKLSQAMFGGLQAIRTGILRLSRGESLQQIDKEYSRKNDEIGVALKALQTLDNRVAGASEFARKLGQNDFTATYNPVSAQDQLGISLNEMKNSLVQAKKDEEIRSIEDNKRNWSTQGIAKFSDILRLNNDNIETLSYNVISNLVEYLNANQAGIFVASENDGEEKVLELSAAFAFDRRKYISRKVQFGEGMVGACAIEKKTMYMKELPYDYIHITSGLGEANPKSLLLVPMIVEEEVLGVIEIASFNEFEQHEIEFVEKIAETIGSTLVTTKVNARTAKLLEESKLRAEEMVAQEEEMRQNMEELQATQEEMRRIKEQEAQKEQERRENEEKIMKELRDKNDEMLQNEQVLNKQKEELSKEKYLMDALMESVPEHIYFKDKDSKFIRFSKSMLKLFGLSSYDELVGKSDFDFFSDEHAQPAFEDEQNIIKTGELIIDKMEKETLNDGTVRWVNTSKLPLKDTGGNIVGTFGISKNVTHLKELEIEADKKAERIKELEAEIVKVKESISDSGKDKTIKNLEKELRNKSMKLDRIREETRKTRDQIDELRRKNKK